MTTSFLTKHVVDSITSRIKLHHVLYSTPITAEHWEEILSRALKENGIPNDWKPNRSHDPAKDMTILLPQSQTVSCKSGFFFPKDGMLYFGGFRTSKHKTLSEKLKYINDNNSDIYFCLPKDKLFSKRYYLLVFEGKILNYNQGWSENLITQGKNKGGSSGYKMFGKNLTAKI